MAYEFAAQVDEDADVGVEVAILDGAGVIVAVNEAWTAFCLANGGDPSTSGTGVSFLAACAAAEDDPAARDVLSAVRAALSGHLPTPLRVEVPCHSPSTTRWFDVLISARRDDIGRCVGATVTYSLAWSDRTEASRLGTGADLLRDGRDDYAAELADLQRRLEIMRQANAVAATERDRAVSDLHDYVIGELFSAAMGLQALTGRLERREDIGRVNQVIDSLDAVIKQIRSTTFGLGFRPDTPGTGV